MNYGYASTDAKTGPIFLKDIENTNETYCLQLYHFLATGIQYFYYLRVQILEELRKQIST